MSFRFAELVSDLQGKTYEPGERTVKLLEATAQTSTFFQQEGNENLLTLAVDNDAAGHKFISKLLEKGIPFKLDIPPIAQEGVEKADWNSFLKEPLQGQVELVHIYSYDKKKKAVAYQGYFSKDLAAEKIAQLTAGDVVAFSASEMLSRDEIEELAANQSQTYQQLSEAKEGLREDVPQTLNIWAGTNENTLLSNLAPSLLVIDGFSYESVEHAYQTLKSGKMNAKAYSWAEKNRAAFKTGQKVQSDRVLGPADTSKNILLMEKLLKERYQQDTSFRQALDATRGKVLTHEQDQGIWKVEFPKILTRIRDKENFKKENRMTEVNKPSIDQLIQDRDLKGLSAHLKEGVRDYFNSNTYKAFLQTMSKFNNYSLNNLFLIVAQKKDASAVASFNAWKKLGRHVLKGQKALKIWAPYQVTRKDEKGQPVLDKKGQEVKDTRFRLVPVFDISQTEGKELPQPVYELEGTHQDYANLYRAAKETAAAKGVRLEISKEPMEAHGYYSPTENKIVIRAGMSERETLSTIFHEMAHADLHNPKALEGQKLTRTNKELQAESVAYVVANHYGLDTSSYSFGYLANWSNEPDSLADLEAQLSIVQKEAADLIKRLDTAFEKYQNKEVSKDPLSQKLEEFNQKCQKKLAEKAASEPEKKSHPQKGDEEKDNQASK